MGEDEEEGAPMTTVRQLEIMSMPSHKNIIKGLGVVVDREDKYLLMEYAEHNLRTLLVDKHVQFSVQEVQTTLAKPPSFWCNSFSNYLL
jgi:hypothetical protein